MRSTLHAGQYEGAQALSDDFTLICRNALVFNTKKDSPFRIAAQRLLDAG